jgi:alpha-glucosidase
MADNQLMSMERDKVTDLHLVMTPGFDRSYLLYDDDGVSNDFRKGDFRKTQITMSGTSVVKLDFKATGEYMDFVERVTVEMIRKERSPFWVALGDEKLEHFLNRRKFEAADKGWYYSQSKRAVLVKYPNPKKDITLTVSFEDFDLIGM